MKIYLTRRNSDMTEGRGPMVNDQVFLYRQDAANYIDYKPGPGGFKQKWSEKPNGDWDIQELEVNEGPFDVQAKILANAKDKLAKAMFLPEELQALGIK